MGAANLKENLIQEVIETESDHTIWEMLEEK